MKNERLLTDLNEKIQNGGGTDEDEDDELSFLLSRLGLD